MCNRSVMELLHLRWRAALEPNGSAIGEGCRFTVDWLTDTERSAIVPVEQANLSRSVWISKRLSDSEDGEHCVIEAL